MVLVSGRYRVLDEIGRGGMSVVWRGHDGVLDRKVAIKMLASGYADDQAFRDRIRREARVAARLSHPHVGTVYDFGETTDGRPYLVMELITGESLAQRLRGAPLPCAQALRLCAQVASALAQSHARGLVHRDVKPGNVMLTPAGAKLVDFGISAMVDEADPAPELPGRVLGTPAYVAPEVLTGRPPGPPADVYALGMLLYRTLTGHLPWPADTPAEVLRAHVHCEPNPLPHLDGLPAEVARLSLRCLAKDPAARPTCAQLARVWSVAAARARAPVAVPSPALAATRPLPALPAPRRRHHRILAVALFGLLALGVIGDSPHARRSAVAAPAVVPSAAALAVTCQVVYQLSTDDGHSFAGGLTVRNTGRRAVPASTLTFAFAGSQHIAGRSFAQRGPTVTVPTGPLPPGGTGTFVFTGRYSGLNAMPTGFTLGGTLCDTRAVGVTGRPPVSEPSATPGTRDVGPHAGSGDTRGRDGHGPAHKKHGQS